MSSLCFTHGIEYSGGQCPRCWAEEQAAANVRQLKEANDRLTERIAAEAAADRDAAEARVEKDREARQEELRRIDAAAEREAATQRHIAAHGWQMRAQAMAESAYQLYGIGLYIDAAAHASKAIEEDRGNLLGYKVRSWCLTRLGRDSEARPDFEQQLALLRADPHRFSPATFQSVMSGLPEEHALLVRARAVFATVQPHWRTSDGLQDLLVGFVRRGWRPETTALVEYIETTLAPIDLERVLPALLQGGFADESRRLVRAFALKQPTLQAFARWLDLDREHVSEAEAALRSWLNQMGHRRRDMVLRSLEEFESQGLSSRSRDGIQTVTHLVGERYRGWAPSIARDLTEAALSMAKSDGAAKKYWESLPIHADPASLGCFLWGVLGIVGPWVLAQVLPGAPRHVFAAPFAAILPAIGVPVALTGWVRLQIFLHTRRTAVREECAKWREVLRSDEAIRMIERRPAAQFGVAFRAYALGVVGVLSLIPIGRLLRDEFADPPADGMTAIPRHGPQGVPDYSCEELPRLRAPFTSTVATFIIFQNNGRTPVQLSWIDRLGRVQHYATVPPGQSYRQPTFLMHPWTASSAGKCLGAWLPKLGGSVVEVGMQDGQEGIANPQEGVATLSDSSSVPGAGTFEVARLSVPATQAWTDAGVILPSARIFITASGKAHPCRFGNCGDKRYESWVGPGGFTELPPLGGSPFPAMGLLARIGESAPFYVGSTWSGTVPAGGRLLFQVNDEPSWGDNDGQFRVTVAIDSILAHSPTQAPPELGDDQGIEPKAAPDTVTVLSPLTDAGNGEWAEPAVSAADTIAVSSLDGQWAGDFSSVTDGRRVSGDWVWTLAQRGRLVSGTWTAPRVSADGSIDGELSNGDFLGRLTIQQSGCSGLVRAAARIGRAQLSGTYEGTLDCPGRGRIAISDGRFNLTLSR